MRSFQVTSFSHIQINAYIFYILIPLVVVWKMIKWIKQFGVIVRFISENLLKCFWCYQKLETNTSIPSTILYSDLEAILFLYVLYILYDILISISRILTSFTLCCQRYSLQIYIIIRISLGAVARQMYQNISFECVF